MALSVALCALCAVTYVAGHSTADDLHDESHLDGPDHDLSHNGFMADPDAVPKRVYTMKCHPDVEFVDCNKLDNPLLVINGVSTLLLDCAMTTLTPLCLQPTCDVAKMTGCKGYETRLEPKGKWLTMIQTWNAVAAGGRLTQDRINNEISDEEHRAQDTLKTLHHAAEQADASPEE